MLLPSSSCWLCLALPHMLLPTMQSAPDRFSAPVASISFNSLGEVLGNAVLHVLCLCIETAAGGEHEVEGVPWLNSMCTCLLQGSLFTDCQRGR